MGVDEEAIHDVEEATSCVLPALGMQLLGDL